MLSLDSNSYPVLQKQYSDPSLRTPQFWEQVAVEFRHSVFAKKMFKTRKVLFRFTYIQCTCNYKSTLPSKHMTFISLNICVLKMFLPLNTWKNLTIAVPPSRSVQQIPQVTAAFVAAYCVCTQLIARFHWQAALINVNASTVVHKGKSRITPTMVASNSIIT